jgi:ABC-type transport system involved in multi-copper enzyme maturation permease subunit
MVYVPQRRLLAGEVSTVHLGTYFTQAAVQAVGWTVLLLILATLIFRRRDFL